jgi:superfamily I DNA/RNA helicase
MVRKVSRRMKENSSLTEFSSLKSFLTSLKIPEDSVFQLPEIIKKIDEREGNNSSLTVNQVNDFINQLTAIKNDLGIKLSTIHGMKGLEADYIFLIFCDQKVLPKKERFNND